MGKLKARPDDYHPLLELRLRALREGGNVLVPGQFNTDIVAQERRSCIVMVHGFNNNDGEAAAAYDGFRARQVQAYGTTVDELNAILGDAFWPGDAAWGWFDLFDFGVYSGAIGHAHGTATELAAMLRRMPNLLDLSFIGHSLGCRVILETIDHLLKAADAPPIRRVCLMAPAVPMEKLEPEGDFHATLTQLAANGTEILVLHSRQDKVLQFAFPIGQAMGGPGEKSDRALGREGPNPMLPGYGGTLDEMQMGGADHGDYWGHSKKPIAFESAKRAGRFFGFDTSGRTVGEPRAVGFSEPGFPSRTAFDDA